MSDDGPDRGDARKVDDRLADWVDGCLKDRERERFVAELRVNPQLRKDLADYERTVASVRQALQAPTAKVDLADRILQQISNAGSERSALHTSASRQDAGVARKGPLGAAWWRQSVLWSLGAAAALLAVAVWLNRSDQRPTKESAAEQAGVSDRDKYGLDDVLARAKASAADGKPGPTAAPGAGGALGTGVLAESGSAETPLFAHTLLTDSAAVSATNPSATNPSATNLSATNPVELGAVSETKEVPARASAAAPGSDGAGVESYKLIGGKDRKDDRPADESRQTSGRVERSELGRGTDPVVTGGEGPGAPRVRPDGDRDERVTGTTAGSAAWRDGRGGNYRGAAKTEESGKQGIETNREVVEAPRDKARLGFGPGEVPTEGDRSVVGFVASGKGKELDTQQLPVVIGESLPMVVVTLSKAAATQTPRAKGASEPAPERTRGAPARKPPATASLQLFFARQFATNETPAAQLFTTADTLITAQDFAVSAAPTELMLGLLMMEIEPIIAPPGSLSSDSEALAALSRQPPLAERTWLAAGAKERVSELLRALGEFARRNGLELHNGEFSVPVGFASKREQARPVEQWEDRRVLPAEMQPAPPAGGAASSATPAPAATAASPTGTPSPQARIVLKFRTNR